jgi:hypothetical protein
MGDSWHKRPQREHAARPGNELQPDAVLYIDPAKGGQARMSTDDHLETAPELVTKVASSTALFDLKAKLRV